jgi:integrase/recombinase XerD
MGMEGNTVSARAEKKQIVLSFISKLGLPKTLADLKIKGTHLVVTSKGLTSRNKELIFRFLNHISPEVSEYRLTFYTHKLRKLGIWLKRDFDAVTEDDIRSLLTFLSKGAAREDGNVFSQGTLHGYKVTFKRFYRWLEGNDEEYPRKVRWIKSSGDKTRIHEPEQLLTFEEVEEMIRHARSPRDKALISFLYESGARISELLSMKVKHLEFCGNIVRATLPVSKTQPRVIPLVTCKTHLSTWMNYHPLKDDNEAPLWSNLKGDGKHPLLGQTVSRILKDTAATSGINKRVYPHLFRACSITHKQAAGWPEQNIKLFHGLCKDSKVMKHYSHLSYSDLEDIQKKMNGLPVEDKPGVYSGIRCPTCGKKNPLYVEVCDCGMPTEMKTALNGRGLPESEIDARVEKKIKEFIECRQEYEQLMERFIKTLLERSRQSPEVLRLIGDIGAQIQDKQPHAQLTGTCQS